MSELAHYQTLDSTCHCRRRRGPAAVATEGEVNMLRTEGLKFRCRGLTIVRCEYRPSRKCVPFPDLMTGYVPCGSSTHSSSTPQVLVSSGFSGLQVRGFVRLFSFLKLYELGEQKGMAIIAHVYRWPKRSI